MHKGLKKIMLKEEMEAMMVMSHEIDYITK